MEQEEIFGELERAVIEGDEDRAGEVAREVLRNGIDPLKAVERGLSKGMMILGDRFERGEIFLPDVLIAAEAFNIAMEVLKPEIEAQRKDVAKAGTVLIGTVKGDVHSLGKNIVATVLEAHGFGVADMGVDNSALNIIQEAEKVKADVIALSSLMTTTMPGQKEVIDVLKEMDLRGKYLVVVGGGPVNQAWADKIGADGYGASAGKAVEIIKKLLGRRE
jgi:trimethylamine corrinoid protein